MTPTEHQAVLRVLQMVDEYLAAQPAETLTASTSGGMMTWRDLRKHVAGAVAIMQNSQPRPGRPAWPGGRRRR